MVTAHQSPWPATFGVPVCHPQTQYSECHLPNAICHNVRCRRCISQTVCSTKPPGIPVCRFFLFFCFFYFCTGRQTCSLFFSQSAFITIPSEGARLSPALTAVDLPLFSLDTPGRDLIFHPWTVALSSHIISSLPACPMTLTRAVFLTSTGTLARHVAEPGARGSVAPCQALSPCRGHHPGSGICPHSSLSWMVLLILFIWRTPTNSSQFIPTLRPPRSPPGSHRFPRPRPARAFLPCASRSGLPASPHGGAPGLEGRASSRPFG